MNEMTLLTNDTALVFVLNRKYLRPLKVLLYSLYEHQALQGCDIVVSTDDERVAKDPFIRRIANSVEFHDEDALRVFSTIRGDKLRPQSRVSFAPKYTFLKFIGFKPRGYRRHIVMDADMLCMNPIDESTLALPYASKAMFEVKGYRFPIRDEDTSRRFGHNQAIDYLEERSNALAITPSPNLPDKINSGFLVLQDDAISEDVFDGAIRLATEHAFGQEQAATTQVLASIGSFMRLPMWYNTRRRIFESMGSELFEQCRDRIYLFHHTPGKPWINPTERTAFMDKPWLDCEVRSQEWVNDCSGSMV